MATYLRQRKTKQIEEAELIWEVSREDFVEMQTAWAQYKAQHRPNSDSENDNWDWLAKSSRRYRTVNSFIGIAIGGAMQGMLMLSQMLRSCRKPGFESKHLYYVEYLESAPWNVPRYAGADALYKGVGVNLISAAVQVSLQGGCEGRLGLHSLEDVDTKRSYLNLGFENLGFDPAEGYDYFEFSGYGSEEKG